mmetsp:Transcript_63288/g.149980  ORF Transcript_63288/g.149980 Transcript_63288/m.149980 type:complete len:259 (+) Transcript_63288:1-777(+)
MTYTLPLDAASMTPTQMEELSTSYVHPALDAEGITSMEVNPLVRRNSTSGDAPSTSGDLMHQRLSSSLDKKGLSIDHPGELDKALDARSTATTLPVGNEKLQGPETGPLTGSTWNLAEEQVWSTQPNHPNALPSAVRSEAELGDPFDGVWNIGSAPSPNSLPAMGDHNAAWQAIRGPDNEMHSLANTSPRARTINSSPMPSAPIRTGSADDDLLTVDIVSIHNSREWSTEAERELRNMHANLMRTEVVSPDKSVVWKL